MRIAKSLAAAVGFGLTLGSVAQAQDFDRDFDQVRASRSESDSVTLRWSTPLGGRADRSASPSLALRFSQNAGSGEMRSLDLVSYSFGADDGQRLSTPFQLNVAGDGGGVGGWIMSHKILAGVGVALLVWGVVEATDDDDDDAPSGVCQTTC